MYNTDGHQATRCAVVVRSRSLLINDVHNNHWRTRHAIWT